MEGPELDTLDEADKAATMKGRKTMVKLPWELMTPFGDFLKTLPGRTGLEDEEEDDDDERQAYHDSMQRLRVSSLLRLEELVLMGRTPMRQRRK